MTSRGSRFTAENQYGMVGFGAGPVGASVTEAPGIDAAAAGISEAAPPSPNGAAAITNLVMPSGVTLVQDPAFWMVATLGAIIALAAYSAGPSR